MTHAATIQTLQTYNEVRLYLHIELAKHPITPTEKNRLAAALAFLQLTQSVDRLKKEADTIFDETLLCDIIKLAKDG